MWHYNFTPKKVLVFLNNGLIPGYMQLIKMATYKRKRVKVLGDILLMYNFISDVQ